jgi:hypothetical protein
MVSQSVGHILGQASESNKGLNSRALRHDRLVFEPAQQQALAIRIGRRLEELANVWCHAPPVPEMPLPPKPPPLRAPALRLASADALRGTEAVLLPTDAVLTSPANAADLAVAALTRALASAAALLVAATPPPVPAAWPEMVDRAAARAVAREAAWADWTVDGVDEPGLGGAL